MLFDIGMESLRPCSFDPQTKGIVGGLREQGLIGLKQPGLVLLHFVMSISVLPHFFFLKNPETNGTRIKDQELYTKAVYSWICLGGFRLTLVNNLTLSSVANRLSATPQLKEDRNIMYEQSLI